MKRRKLRIAVILLLVAATTAWYVGPRPWMKLTMRVLGCEYKTIETPSFTAAYYDSGNENLPPMVLTHGFLVDGVLNWFNMVPRLKNTYRLIIPDLLNADHDYVRSGAFSFQEERNFLKELCAVLELENPRMVFFSASSLLAADFTETAEVFLVSPPPLNEQDYFKDVDVVFRSDADWFALSTFTNPPPGMWLFTKFSHPQWQNDFIRLHDAFVDHYPAWSRLDPDAENLRIIIPSDDRFFPSARSLLAHKNAMPLPKSGHGATWDQPEALAAILLSPARNKLRIYP